MEAEECCLWLHQGSRLSPDAAPQCWNGRACFGSKKRCSHARLFRANAHQQEDFRTRSYWSLFLRLVGKAGTQTPTR